MKLEQLEVREALEQGSCLPWALVRSLSRVTLGPAPESLDPAELVEARFFDSCREVRIFRNDGALQAVCLTGEEQDSTLEETYDTAGDGFSGRLTLCRVLDADEDGQTYIRASRLMGWEGGEDRG